MDWFIFNDRLKCRDRNKYPTGSMFDQGSLSNCASSLFFWGR